MEKSKIIYAGILPTLIVLLCIETLLDHVMLFVKADGYDCAIST